MLRLLLFEILLNPTNCLEILSLLTTVLFIIGKVDKGLITFVFYSCPTS